METKNIEIVGSVFRKFKQISPRWAKMFFHELKANSQKLSDIGELEYDEINNLLGKLIVQVDILSTLQQVMVSLNLAHYLFLRRKDGVVLL